MKLKQWLIKKFNKKPIPIERGLPEVVTTPPMPAPKAPDINHPAQELAEAIENGKIKLHTVSKGQYRTYLKHLGLDTEFFYDNFNGKLNTISYAFTEDEAKLLGQALLTYDTKEALAKKAETRNEIAEYLNKLS